MATPRIDLGKLTDEETIALAVDALNWLSEDDRCKAILQAVTDKGEREELAAQLQPDA